MKTMICMTFNKEEDFTDKLFSNVLGDLKKIGSEGFHCQRDFFKIESKTKSDPTQFLLTKKSTISQFIFFYLLEL